MEQEEGMGTGVITTQHVSDGEKLQTCLALSLPTGEGPYFLLKDCMISEVTSPLPPIYFTPILRDERRASVETIRALAAGSKGQWLCDLPHVTRSSLLMVKISNCVCQQSNPTLNKPQVLSSLVFDEGDKSDIGT